MRTKFNLPKSSLFVPKFLLTKMSSNLLSRKKKAFAATAGLLLLLGAGCAPQTAPSTRTDAYNTTPVDTNAGSSASSGTNSSVTTPTESMTQWKFPGVLPAERIHNKQARISTNKGDIVIAFYDDTAPNTVSNFVYLAEGGYYDNVIFHRVIEGFMIQGGDPQGTGTGGPGYKFADELKDDHQYSRGTVAMANAGPNTNGSQFFIMHRDYPLPHSYSIFGHVVEGMDVVDAIATTATGPGDRPTSEIVMNKVTIEDAK